MNRMGQTTERESPFGREQLRDLPAARVIPYDYVAKFKLTGNVGNLIQDVINISVEGVFVAVSIGYGFDEERAEPLTLLTGSGRPSPNPSTLGNITLDNIPSDVLIEGFRINPAFEAIAVQNGQLNANLPFDVAKGIFQRLKQTENFGFLLNIVDTATGRELQNEPVHSVATLGRADGRRPFKMLPQPMVFMPRSTIRLQVEERMAGVKGRLFITLQGYKVLGLAGGMEEEVRRLGEFHPLQRIPVYDHETGNYRTLGEAIQRDIPTTKIVPFDYVSTLDLTGKPGNLVEDEVPINVDGGYVTTVIGYSLDVEDTSVQIKLEKEPTNKTDLVNVKDIKLKEIKTQALLDGIRIHPLRVRFAFTSGGGLSTMSRDMVDRLFHSLNRPEDVRFLYSFSDSGTGRDLQNQPIHSVAGLGIANGDRPFKVLHKPMTFLPRSSIQVQVEEIFGRGRLYIVFQGYKILS
ncbi:hypothetical protein HYR99_16220 [Candidatus Poribacteria bacterium]|nr:hypothetical protein [Candidatus Poribacteria bacterium]